jgi:pimeloyl-ACP methyl ester carboxylesterase
MTGPDVLLLHGLASSARHGWADPGWIDLLESASRRPLAIDLPGHGAAAKPHDPVAYATVEQDILAWLDDREGTDGKAPVDAVGFSAGGQVLLRMAAASPAAFRRIAVLGVGHLTLAAGQGTTGDPPPRATDAAEVIGRLARQPGNDPEALSAFASRPAVPLTPALLGMVTAQALIVAGDQDFSGSPGPVAALIPGARAQTVRGLDHFATPGDRRVMRAVLSFITGQAR